LSVGRCCLGVGLIDRRRLGQRLLADRGRVDFTDDQQPFLADRVDPAFDSDQASQLRFGVASWVSALSI